MLETHKEQPFRFMLCCMKLKVSPQRPTFKHNNVHFYNKLVDNRSANIAF